MSEWKEVTLSDVTSVLGDGIHGTPIYSENGDYYFINGNNLCEGKIIFKSDTKRVSENEYLKYRKNLTDRSILFSINGTVGNVAKYNGEPCILGKSACYFNIIDSVDKDYIYYVVSSPSFVKSMSNLANGTTIKNVSLKQMREKRLYLPPLEIQQSIASILSSLDDKIAVNKKICENLEAQAQALFKHWFVDFAPFKDGKFVESELGMIPDGWRVEPLSVIIRYQEGPGIRNWQYVYENGTKFINIRCIKDGDIITDTANMISNEEANGKYSHFMLQAGDIVMSCSGTLGRYAIVRKDHLPLCLNTSVIRFKPVYDFDYSYVLGTLTSTYFLNKQLEMACGSVQANFGPTHLKQINILIPPESIRKQFNEKCYDIINNCQNLKKENKFISTLRDTLLPKLMSGQIKLSEYE